MADKNKPAATLANWKAWTRNGVEQRGEEAARRARYLDSLPAGHASLDGVSPDDRDDFSRQLHAAAKRASR